MSQRGATNQAVEDWRAKQSATTKMLQHDINKNRAPKPDLRYGVDLLAIILIITVVCFSAGYLTGRH